MIPDVFQKVTGTILPSEPGLLADFDRYCLRNKPYPGIIPRKNASTQGVIYTNLTTGHIEKLDTFEGDLYKREKVVVSTKMGGIDAFVYILKRSCIVHLSSKRWSRNEFESLYLDHFLEEDPGFANSSREEDLLNSAVQKES